MQIQVCECEVDGQPVRVLRDASIADFYKTKDSLEHVEEMFDPRAHARFRTVFRSLAFGEPLSTCRAVMRKVSGVRSARSHRSGLPPIRSIAPHARFASVEQFG